MPIKPKPYTIFKNEDGTICEILIKHVRISYPSLFERAKYEGVEQPRGFQLTALLDKEEHAQTAEALNQVLSDHLKDLKLAKVKDDFCFLVDGDDHNKDDYDGCWVVKAKNNNRPAVYAKRSVTPITDPADSPIYAGCYVHIKISVWSQKKSSSGMVLADLIAVQFAEDGEPFGGGHLSEVEKAKGFSSVDDEDDFLAA